MGKEGESNSSSSEKIENFYRDITENAEEIIFIINQDYNCLYVNKYGGERVGLPPSKIVGKNLKEIFPPKIAEGYRTSLGKVFQTGENLSVKGSFIDKTGQRWIETKLSPLKRNGKIFAVLGLSRDITEKVKIEEDLKESEERYKLVSEKTDKLVYDYNVSTGSINWFGNILSITGFTNKEFNKMDIKKWEEMIHPEDRKEAVETLDKAMKNKSRYNVIYRFIKKNKEYIWVQDEGIFLYDDKNVAYRMLGAMADITERKKTEEELKSEKEKDEAILNNTQVGILKVDINSRILYSNPAFSKIIGYSREELKKLTFRDFTHPEDLEKSIDKVKELSSGKIDSFSLEKRYVRKDKKVIYGKVNLSSVKDSSGKVIYEIVSLEDITEKKKAEENLEKSEEMIRSVSNNIKKSMIYRVIRLKNGSRKFTYVSDSVKEFYGITPEEAMRNSSLIYNKVCEEDKKRVFNEEEKANKTLSPFTTEARIKYPSGNIRWSYFNSFPKKLEDGSTQWDGVELDITERKKAEEELKESEEKFRRLFEAARDAILILDSDTGKIVDSNPFIENLLGYSTKELLGKKVFEISPLKDIVENKRKLKDLINKGYTRYENLPLETKSGKKAYVEFVSNVYSVGDKKVIQCNIRDITDRHKFQEELKEKEKRFRELFNNMEESVAIYEIKNNGKDIIIRDFNKSAEILERVKKQDVLGKKVEEVFKGVKEFGLYEVFQKVWKTGKAMRHPISFYKDKYHQGWRDNFIFKLPSGEIVAIYSDVTIEMMAQKDLKESEEKYRSLFQNMINGFALHKLILDNNGKPKDYQFLEVNDAFEEMTGLKRKEIIGEKVTHVIPDIKKDPANWIEVYGNVALTGKEIQFENYSQGLQKWFKITAFSNKRGYFATIFEDITKLKEAQEVEAKLKAKEESDKLKAEFISSVSHELRTPITPIKSQVQRIIDKDLNKEEIKEASKVILRNTLRLDRLIQDLLEISRIQVGGFKILKKKSDINQVIVEAIENIGLLAQQNSTKINFEKKNLPLIEIDKDRILEVFINIMDNAIKYGGGQININEKVENKKVIIYIQDNGKGINKEDTANIFTPFYRSESERILRHEGTGLGLAISKGIVESHKGKIKIDSSLNKGTTVSITLPIK